jgi:hypothetical protein
LPSSSSLDQPVHGHGETPKQIWLEELDVLEMELKQIRQMLEKEPEFARFLYTTQD